ncbi:hypothetical protein P692DRAFT_201864861 [Suillus brevipes Sb2]|nr:hypothetical protein P692DRAFT_201864861 [Suillus brevipes Sb2]
MLCKVGGASSPGLIVHSLIVSIVLENSSTVTHTDAARVECHSPALGPQPLSPTLDFQSLLPTRGLQPISAALSLQPSPTTQGAQPDAPGLGLNPNSHARGLQPLLSAIDPQPLSPARDLQLPLPTREPTSAALDLLHSVFSVFLGLSHLVFLSLSAFWGLRVPHLPPRSATSIAHFGFQRLAVPGPEDRMMDLTLKAIQAFTIGTKWWDLMEKFHRSGLQCHHGLETVGIPSKGHIKLVTGIALSFDGALLSSTSNDKTIELWAFESRQLLASFDLAYIKNTNDARPGRRDHPRDPLDFPATSPLPPNRPRANSLLSTSLPSGKAFFNPIRSSPDKGEQKALPWALCEFCLVRHCDLNIASSATFTINFLSSTEISLFLPSRSRGEKLEGR